MAVPLHRFQRGCAALLAWTCAALVQAAPAAEPVPQGFIVRLRDAPAHSQWREDRQQAASASRVAARVRWTARWQGVLRDAGLASQSGWRLQPVGLASHLLLPPRPLSASEAARWQAALSASPEVAWVQADVREPALQAAWPQPDDPLFTGLSGQWWLQPASGSNANAIEARLRGVPGLQRAWARGTGSAATVIAVLDTGLTAHPDLNGARILPGFDMVSDWDSATGRGYANDGDGRDADPTDPGDWVSAADKAADAGRYGGCSETSSTWHGTVVAGMVAAESGNAYGGAGADWAARILPVRVAGKCGASVRDIVDGMRWAAGLAVCQRYTDTLDPTAGCQQWAPVNPNPARVVNISFGGAQACGAEYQAAVDELWALGVVVVAAAGNDHAAPSRPANCQQAIGVVALNRDGFKANYSNFGAGLSIATVGGDDSGGRWGSLLADSGLLALTNDGAQSRGSAAHARHYGTSFAAPVVSAAVGLMLAADPALSAAEIATGLAQSARPHLGSSVMPVCSSTNPGRCICTSATCGAGILDADQAVAYAQARAAGQVYQAPAWPQEWLDTPELTQAVALGPDRETAASTGSTGSDTSGQGGGAAGGLLCALLALAWLGLARRA